MAPRELRRGGATTPRDAWRAWVRPRARSLGLRGSNQTATNLTDQASPTIGRGSRASCSTDSIATRSRVDRESGMDRVPNAVLWTGVLGRDGGQEEAVSVPTERDRTVQEARATLFRA